MQRFYCSQLTKKKENQTAKSGTSPAGQTKKGCVSDAGPFGRISLPASARSALWAKRLGVRALFSVLVSYRVRLPLDFFPRLPRAWPLNPLCHLALPGAPNLPDCPGLLDVSSNAAALNGTYLPRTTCPRRRRRAGCGRGSSAPGSAGLPQ